MDMKKTSRSVLVAVASLTSCAVIAAAQTKASKTRPEAPSAVKAAPAQPLALKVNMGLWQMTSVTNLSGQLPGVDTSKLTPEQQARVQAAMQGLLGQHTATTKSCITPDKFNIPSMMGDSSAQSCAQTVSTNTSSTLDVTVTCTGNAASTTHLHFTALSPTAVSGTGTTSVSQQGKAMNMTMTVNGTWLGSDCKGADN